MKHQNNQGKNQLYIQKKKLKIIKFLYLKWLVHDTENYID